MKYQPLVRMTDVLFLKYMINRYRQNTRKDSAVAKAADKQLRNNLQHNKTIGVRVQGNPLHFVFPNHKDRPTALESTILLKISDISI